MPTIKIAVSHVVEQGTFEWPQSPCILVKIDCCVNIDNLILTFDFCKVTFAFTAYTHEV